MALVVEVLGRSPWPQDARVKSRRPHEGEAYASPGLSRSFKTDPARLRKGRPMSETTLDTTIRLMPEAGATVAAAIRASAGTDLSGPTPCGDWDLRTLVRHFVGTSGAFVRAGRTKALDPDDPWGAEAVLDESDWSGQLAGQVEDVGEAWRRPEAWAGSVEGASMPATAVGELGLIELMLHGWDVTRAGGQDLQVSDELGAEVFRCLEPTLEQGRQFEVYGPPVRVAETAAPFARALGAAGRDPDWRP
jgi:uncharacterized protein (TIGR03086 family)